MAYWNLGWMYENGIGVKRDWWLAKRSYDQAGEMGGRLPVVLSLAKLYLRRYVPLGHFSFYASSLSTVGISNTDQTFLAAGTSTSYLAGPTPVSTSLKKPTTSPVSGPESNRSLPHCWSLTSMIWTRMGMGKGGGRINRVLGPGGSPMPRPEAEGAAQAQARAGQVVQAELEIEGTQSWTKWTISSKRSLSSVSWLLLPRSSWYASAGRRSVWPLVSS